MSVSPNRALTPFFPLSIKQILLAISPKYEGGDYWGNYGLVQSMSWEARHFFAVAHRFDGSATQSDVRIYTGGTYL